MEAHLYDQNAVKLSVIDTQICLLESQMSNLKSQRNVICISVRYHEEYV